MEPGHESIDPKYAPTPVSPTIGATASARAAVEAEFSRPPESAIASLEAVSAPVQDGVSNSVGAEFSRPVESAVASLEAAAASSPTTRFDMEKLTACAEHITKE